MKKRMKKLAAMLLLGCMVAGNVPGGLVYAEESDPVTAESQTEEITKNEESNSESDTMPDLTEDTEDGDSIEAEDNQTSENDVQEAENDQASESDVQEIDDAEKLQESDGKETGDQNEESIEAQASENSIIEKNADAINYVIVESPYLETPGTERIAISYGDGSENISDATLTVRDDEGRETIWDLSVSADQLYLFTYEYTDESETGTYEVISLNVTDDTGEKAVLLSESGMEANFGVNEEYNGIEELQPLDVETAKSRTADEAADVEATVAEIDPDNVEESTEQIVNALENAEEQTGGAADSSAGISAFAATMGAKAKAAAAKSDDGNIVVALDPGHDSTHAGASSNGLREEVLTLKIANYCKEELEKYAGVTVYMTRTGAACPHPGGSSGSDIGDRVYAAADAGADIYVSLHLNSSTASSVNGSEVIIPNKSWKPQVAEEGEKLAEAILKELKAIGLNMRPDEIYSKDTTINERYPDGSISDYFSVQIYAKERGIPGIIVEHAFITNSGDRNYLNSESGLKKLGVADATGIAKYLGLHKIGDMVSVPEGTYVLESALGSGKVATVSGGGLGDSAAITLNSNKKISSQRFEITSAGNGYYTITAEHSGKVLDIKNGSSTSGTAIQQYTSNDTSAQKWGFVNAGNGYYYICSALGTFMDVKNASSSEGTTIQSYSYNGTTAQKWKLVKSDYRPVEDGTYTISSSANDSLVVEVADGAFSDKSNVQLNNKNSMSHQNFEIKYVENGYYKIVAEHSNKVLDVHNADKNSGANVWQYAWNGSSAQLWKFIDAGNGMFYIKSKLGTVLGIASTNSYAGVNICTQNISNNNTLKWKLKETSWPVEEGRYYISSAKSDKKILSIRNGYAEVGAYAGLQSQMFDIKKTDENGYYTIASVASNKVLDVRNASTDDRAALWEYSDNGSDAQKWKFIYADQNSFYIKSKLGTVIDIKFADLTLQNSIWMYTINQSETQKWSLVPADNLPDMQPIENGTYCIRNMTNLDYVMDVTYGSESNNEKIRMYSANDTSAQRFEIFYVGNGYYRILSEKSGKALDVEDKKAVSGTPLQQYSWYEGTAQLWRIIDNGNGSYYFQSKLGTVMDIDSSEAELSSKLVLNEMEDNDNSQKWVVERTNYKPVEDGLYSLRSASNLRYTADIANASKDENANVWLYSYNGTQAQYFEINYIDNGYYKITNPYSDKVIQCESDSYSSGANVNQGTWNGSDKQLWKFVKGDGSGVYIRSKTGVVLDIHFAEIQDKSNIQVYEANNTNAQKWILRPEWEAEKITEGEYIITSALSNSMVLDVHNGSKDDRANIQIYKSNGTDAQVFKVESVADGYYKIINAQSGKVLDVKFNSYDSGTNVWQYQWNGSDAQQWKFIKNDDGTYYIQSKLGTVLDVQNSSAALGANVQSYELNQTEAQKWKLNDPLYEIMGNSTVTVDQMVSLYKNYSKVNYPYENVEEAPTIRDFCEIYIEECEIENVKVEVAFCQAMLETGFLRFGGDVKKEQFNFAGIGAVGGGASGATFKTIREGVRAQVQHLKAYASTGDLKQPLVDPRFQYVKRGCAEYVQWLGKQENPDGYGWAASENYGINIVRYYLKPLTTKY